MQRARGWLTVWILPFIAIAGSVAPLVYSWNRYPDPVAVHWGISGEPNGTLPLWLYAIGVVGGMLLSWYGLITGTRRGPNAPLTTVAYFIIGLFAAINAQVLYSNLDTGRWQDARNLDALTLAGLLVMSLLAAGLGWLLAGGKGAVPADVPIEVPDTAATTWSGTASNLWVAFTAAVPIAFAFVLEPVWIALMVVIALLVVTFAFVRVDVDDRAVRIALGPLGLPKRKLPIRKITGAGAIEIRPLAYGGWGWRIRPGRRSYMIRGGPAIRIERPNGVAVIVTVDDAPEGAAVIDSLARARKYG